MNEAVQRFGAVYAALETELDWELLGNEYCEGDGAGFFDAALRARMLDSSLRIADELANRLQGNGPRRSVYLGAALAELAPMLVEHLVLQREVIWLNLDCVETRELRRAIGVVENRSQISLPKPGLEGLECVKSASCDHLWMASVLSDPDHFPALHDELYERAGGKLATGRGAILEDRSRAERLVRGLLACAASPGTLTTSDEELEFLTEIAHDLGWRIEVSDTFHLSVPVGDALRICALIR